MTMDASERTPYAHALGKFARRETLRLNTPGHNASELASEALAAFFGPEALLLDAQPLLSGLDKGENNPFDRAVQAAARAWGARRSWFLTNGASQGNRMAALALAQFGSAEQPVITQRSAHSSFIDGIILGGISPRFVQPTIDTQYGINHGITPEVFAQVVAENPDAKAAYVISPSYFGAVADIAALADIAHAAGMPLILSDAVIAHHAFLKPNENGFLFKNGDIQSLTSALKTMMETADEQRSQMGHLSARLAGMYDTAAWSSTLHKLASV